MLGVPAVREENQAGVGIVKEERFMEQLKQQWLPRAFIGALAGIAFFVFLGCSGGGLGHFGPTVFRYLSCRFYVHNESLGILLSLVLFALFGAEVGVATLPFADSGTELVVRSLVHFTVMTVTVSAWVVLNLGAVNLIWFLLPLTLVYASVWLGRWVGWFAEVAAIRAKLGLAPGPSLFHWRESLPYVGFAFLLCLVLPVVLEFCDAVDVPALGILYAFLVLSVGGFMAGLSLGRRHGLCPLYPVACAVFIGAFILTGPRIDGGILFAIAVIASLTGNLAGAARHRMKRDKGVNTP